MVDQTLHTPQNGRKPNLLIFDIVGVLVTSSWDTFVKNFVRGTGADEETIRNFFDHPDFHNGTFERGTITAQQLLDRINKGLKTSVSLADFEDLWTVGFGFVENHGISELLGRLKKQSKLCALSNADAIYGEYLKRVFGVTRHFDDAVFSCEVGMVKPEAGIYVEVLKRFDVQAHDCLFIDDILRNVEGARTLQIKSHHFSGLEPLRNELQDFGFKV